MKKKVFIIFILILIILLILLFINKEKVTNFITTIKEKKYYDSIENIEPDIIVSQGYSNFVMDIGSGDTFEIYLSKK